LNNRYILTDLGGVSFQHGLDAGRKGETDDITRLDLDQHVFHIWSSSKTPGKRLSSMPNQIEGQGGSVGFCGDEYEGATGKCRGEDMDKMHAYRDAIRNVYGAFALYPGEASIILSLTWGRTAI
jgi:hypothetical protein